MNAEIAKCGGNRSYVKMYFNNLNSMPLFLFVPSPRWAEQYAFSMQASPSKPLLKIQC